MPEDDATSGFSHYNLKNSATLSQLFLIGINSSLYFEVIKGLQQTATIFNMLNKE